MYLLEVVTSLIFLPVYKYKKDTDASLGDKLSKLSLHSIRKKSSRIRERFSVNLGFFDQTRDENFDKEETRYRSLEKIVRVFVKDVQVYIDQIIVSFFFINSYMFYLYTAFKNIDVSEYLLMSV